MKKSVKEALDKIGNFGDYKGVLKNSMVCKEAYNTIKNELKWLDHYSKHIEMLESKLDRIEEVVKDIMYADEIVEAIHQILLVDEEEYTDAPYGDNNLSHG